MVTLTAKNRDKKGKLNLLREEGLLPAVMYGKETPSTPITISEKEFKKVWRDAGESSMIVLDVEGKKYDVLIQDIDLHPVTDQARHADFYVVEKGQKVRVEVPLEFVGESPAVKGLGCVLVKVIHDLEIEAESKNLPHSIAVDISSLALIDSHIAVGDLVLPNGVVATADKADIVVSASLVKEEEETITQIDMSAVEVAKKGKVEKEA